MLVQEPVGWILKLSISQSLMKHRKLKSPFQPLKVTGSFKKWAIVSWFPFGLFVVNLLLYNINIEKKNRIETMILSLPGSWSQLSHWWSCNILFGIFHKSFLYLFLYFFWSFEVSPFLLFPWSDKHFILPTVSPLNQTLTF